MNPDQATLSDSLKKNGDLTAVFILVSFLAFLMLTMQYLMVTLDINFIVHKGKETLTSSNLNKFQFPIDITANCILGFIVILSGANAGRSFLKIGLLPEDADIKSSEIPPWKTKQVFIFLWVIAALAIYATILQVLVDGTTPDFAVKEWYNTIIATVLSYVAIRTVPKVGEGVYITTPPSLKAPSKEKKEEKDKGKKDK